MSHQLLGGEKITVTLNQSENPISLTWQGRKYTIEHVHQRQEVDLGWWSDEGRTHRNLFTVTTTDGMLCVIYFDHLDEQWYIEKVHD